MNRPIARVAPLVEELGAFCRGHEEDDGGDAAEQMLAHLRASWPDVPHREIADDPDGEQDLEVLALRVVADVGDVARRLLEHEAKEALGWSRSNLILDLEHYLEAIEGS